MCDPVVVDGPRNDLEPDGLPRTFLPLVAGAVAGPGHDPVTVGGGGPQADGVIACGVSVR